MGECEVIIYGPACCGKTSMAPHFCKHFDKYLTVDKWVDHNRPPREAVVLNELPPPYRYARPGARILSFVDAVGQLCGEG